MPETEKVTAGPWYCDLDTADQMRLIFANEREPLRVATVSGDYEDDWDPAPKANCEFIVSAVNACFEVADNDPERAPLVAAEIAEAFRLLRLLSGEAEEVDVDCYQLVGHEGFNVGDAISDAKAIIQRIRRACERQERLTNERDSAFQRGFEACREKAIKALYTHRFAYNPEWSARVAVSECRCEFSRPIRALTPNPDTQTDPSNGGG